MIRDFPHGSYQPKIKIRKDYKKKHFTNPYFNQAHKKAGSEGFNTKLYLKIILVLFLLYLAVYSDLFKIKVIEIKGTDLIDPAAISQIVNEQINSWRWFLLPQNNLLLLSQKRITRAVNAKYRLEKIEIHRGWQKLKIEVKEKVNYLIVIDKSKSFFTDEQGLIVREITPAEMADYSAKLPLLNTDQEIKVGDQVVKKEIVDFILKLSEKIQATSIGVSGYQSGGQTEVTLITKTGWQAHFDINNDLDIAIANLQLILNDKVKNQNNLEYIDLRFGDKVFYK